MRIEGIEPEFSDGITDQQRAELLEQMVLSASKVLLVGKVMQIKVQRYIKSAKVGRQHTLENYTFRLKCISAEGLEEVICGKNMEGEWLAVKMPKTPTRAYRKTSHP